MIDQFFRILPLIAFLIVITLVFYHILANTKSVIIFLSILFAFYIIFRYIFRQVELVYNPKNIPIVTDDDLGRYTLESGVELRELQEGYQDYLATDDDDDEDDE